jgi:hypothetical protein
MADSSEHDIEVPVLGKAENVLVSPVTLSFWKALLHGDRLFG